MLTLKERNVSAVVMCVMVHEKASNISMAFGAHCCLLCVWSCFSPLQLRFAMAVCSVVHYFCSLMYLVVEITPHYSS